jgi:N-acyl-L-homoserine lactone synthetase
MASVAMGNNGQLSTTIVEMMHEFRHRVFVKRLGWSLPVMNGLERDQYDTPEAKYVIVSDSAGRITACARLLPTTDSYMLPELFPQLLGSCAAPSDAAVWELSRFATSVRETREGRILSLSKPTLDLLDLVFDFAREHNIVRLILVTSIGIERLMLRAGVPVHRIAPPDLVDGSLTVALFIEITPRRPEPVNGTPRKVTLDQEAMACV